MHAETARNHHDVADAVLWQAALDGDAAAFTAVYDRHADRVYGFLAARVGACDAEDLTAQVFLEAWRQRDRLYLDEHAGLRPWLYAVAINLIRENRRRAWRSERLLRRLPGPVTVDDPATAVVERDEAAGQLRRARQALGTLSQADQDVVTLCLLCELTPTQAAAVLRQRPSTVRSRLSRARARLARAYTALDGNT